MRKIIDIAILIFVLFFGFFAVKNAHTIGDRLHSLKYTAPAEIVKIADAASMTEKSKLMFYRFSPTLLSQYDLDFKCGVKKLGCTSNHSIYILNYNGDKELNQSSVTAAHEMLHVAYSRLSGSQKNKINKLIDSELEKPEASDIKDKLSGYSADDYYDEAHSFVGTELASISLELDEYYSKFFINRNKIITAFQNSP